MNSLQTAFAALQTTGHRALVPYITGGYPDYATTVEILRRLPVNVCACAEIGIPFSDPIADGPVIQASFSRALERGFRVGDLFAAIRSARATIAVPLVAMVSYSIVYRRKPEAFVAGAREAGIDGLIVPDLALEEAGELARCCANAGMSLIMMVTPTSTPERRARIAELSDPFIYYQSLAGVTGERRQLPPDLADHVTALRGLTRQAICVGFGISTPAQVAAVCEHADGAIIGSALVRRMNEAYDRAANTQTTANCVLAAISDLAKGLPPRLA